MKDVEVLDLVYKEVLEVILRDRGGIWILEVFIKVMGGLIGSLFGEGGYLRDLGYLNWIVVDLVVVEIF